MARNLGGFLVLFLAIAICEAASIFQPISDSHRSAALELFSPTDGSFGSLEDTYEALRTFEILGIKKRPDISTASCQSVSETLGSSTSSLKDVFHALKVNNILKCKVNDETFQGVAKRLKAVLNDASSLLDFYYSIGSLVLIKDQNSEVDVLLHDADGVFRSIKALSQSDGRWRYSSNNPESSTYAAGLALEALAGTVSLASSEIDQSLIVTLKNDIVKLFDSIEKYDDGSFYFDEKLVDAREHQGPLSTTSSVVRGFTAFASVTSGIHFLDVLPKSVDVGNYKFVFEIVLHDSEDKNVYATGGQTQVPVFVTGLIKIDNAEIAVLDSDHGSVETQKKLDLAGENAVSLSANHLQKLRLSFRLATPRGNIFKPHQAFLKLRHETKVEHIFVVGNSGKQFEIILVKFLGSTDFLGLVEKFFYLSGRYDIELTVGDAVMENSFLRAVGHVELDLPEAPEKAPRPPPLAVDPSSRYGPKAEITHIFRSPEKRPPQELSLAFLGLTLLPLVGFLIGVSFFY
ncbi:dolichyl-diphosphooligosaccharide--protein glycosyltransferase subunit 2 [Quercus suber]|uniref:Dolichyl-diphosphooligosaccharide--protein glycosyltransferase subunit 2 n=1 Tax=Quercus suber TaxID=58331 RepID=A0AAW0L497_QUESU